MLQNTEINNNYIQYDIIFIGQLGAVVCNMLIKMGTNNYKYLIINNTKIIRQPSLLPIQSSIIKIQKNYPQQSDYQTQSIFKINGKDNTIIMRNKQIYRYRYLVYTADVEQWADYSNIQNLQPALLTNYSFVYSNILKSQPAISTADTILQKFQKTKKLQLKRMSNLQSTKLKIKQQNSQRSNTQRPLPCTQSTINIIFYLPCPPHCGYDNFNILYKYDQFVKCFNATAMKLRKRSQKIRKTFDMNSKNINSIQDRNQNFHTNSNFNHNENQNLQLNFLLLLQGNDIYPQCKQLDEYIKQKIVANGINIMRKHQINKIDYLRRNIQVTNINTQTKLKIKYDYLYVYLKQKQTSLLQLSKINPFNNCGKTLRNLEYSNIYIYGADIFPTSHSYRAINNQAYVIANNLLMQLQSSTSSSLLKTAQNKIPRQCKLYFYGGLTQIKLWVGLNQCISVQHQYQSQDNIKQDQQNKNNGVNIDDRRCCFSSLLAVQKHKFIYDLQVKLFYNLKSYGPPFYFFMPELPNQPTNTNNNTNNPNNNNNNNTKN